MKTKKSEKKMKLKKITIANLNNQEMQVARGGYSTCPTTPDCTENPGTGGSLKPAPDPGCGSE